ncbi:MAG: hypothetical protein WC003_03550 [Terrimicrobiaceae bacterium]
MTVSPRKCLRAFSLIEVVLAVGLTAFALLIVIGGLGVAMNTNAASSHKSMLVSMTAQVLNEMRALPFSTFWLNAPPAPGSFPAEPPYAAAASTNTPAWTYYFTKEGEEVDSSQVPGNGAVIYRCVVTKTPDTNTQVTNNGAFRMVKIQLAYSWPYPAGTSRQVIHATIARH